MSMTTQKREDKQMNFAQLIGALLLVLGLIGLWRKGSIDMKKFVALVITVLLLQGCGAKEFIPREIVAETDVCKVCNMSIVHEEYAGQVALSNGDYEMFDDLGCLVQYVTTLNEGKKEQGS